MNRYDRLLSLLKQQFPAAQMQLMDNSAEHAGHKHGFDGETHYILRIRDAGFAGLTRLQMHRRIIAAVQSEIDAGLHSFVIEDCGT